MTSLLAMMAACMPSSTIDINTPMRLPIPYMRECSCGNSGRVGGVWLNYYSPCRCGGTTIVLDEPFPLPPLREDLLDTHPSVYAPSLNSGYFGGLHHSVFAPTLDLIHPHYDHLLDHRFLNHHSPLDFKISRRFSDIGQGFPIAAAVPEPGTLALLAVGTAAIIRRRKRA